MSMEISIHNVASVTKRIHRHRSSSQWIDIELHDADGNSLGIVTMFCVSDEAVTEVLKALKEEAQ